MITIFVGDVTYKLRDVAVAYDSSATMAHESDEQLGPGTYYTSLGDLPSIEVLYRILNQADTIIYHPPVKWSDEKNLYSDMKTLTEFFLLYFRRRKTVVGLDLVDPTNISIDLADTRKTNTPQLWIAGCSISHGIGVNDDQRYGQIIAQQLGLPVSFLTAPGGSNEWAGEQILMSDIRPGDTVIFGLTSFNRFVFYANDVHHINVYVFDNYPIVRTMFGPDILDSNFLKYKSLSHIYQVSNFCKQIGCKLLFAGLLINQKDIVYVQKISNYVQLLGSHGLGPHMFHDIGTDGHHPGPLSHQWYAEQILDALNDI